MSYPAAKLDPTKNEIRLLHLLPGVFESTICCNLKVISLKDVKPRWRKHFTRATYEALSYTWGSSQRGCSITLNGVPGNPVTDNLESALRRLRFLHDVRKLWVDAICINQMDLPERNDQVARMGSIYRAASEVIVWLGDVNEPSEGPVVATSNMNSPGQPPDPEHQWLLRSLRSLVNSTNPLWWNRSWVIQEFCLAKNLPVVHFGRWRIPWENFQSLTMELLNEENPGWYMAVYTPVSNLHNIRTTWIAKDLSLMDLALFSTATKARDSKDKVYALLGLMKPDESSMISPDYSQTAATIFATATRASISTTSNLDILKIVSFRDRGQHGLPTWVVNFDFVNGRPGGDAGSFGEYKRSVQDEVLLLWTWTHAAISAKTEFSIDLKILHVKGLWFDRLQRLISMPPAYERPSIDTVLPRVESGMKSMRNSNPYRTLSSLGHDQLREDCLCANNAIDWSPLITPSQWRKEVLTHPDNPFGWDIRTLIGVLYTSWQSCVAPQSHSKRDPRSFRNELFDAARGHYDYTELVAGHYDLFITARGFLGTAPSGIREGDFIALLYGSDVPAVLRPLEVGQLTFHGFAHVHGIMNGELLATCSEPELEQREFAIC